MDSQNSPQKAFLFTLPTELIHHIGSSLPTPRDLLRFTLTCRRVYSTFGLVDMVRLEIKNQKRADYDDFDSKVDRQTEYALAWAIKTRKNIDYIQICVDVYRENEDGFIDGLWSHLGRKQCFCEIPSPLYTAVETARLDVIQLLVDNGASLKFRGRHQLRGTLEDPQRSWPVTYQILSNAGSWGEEAFTAACKTKREDIIVYLMSNGLGNHFWDLWSAIRFGLWNIVDVLLKKPYFDTAEGQLVVKGTLDLAVANPIEDQGIIERLFEAYRDQPFSRVNFLRESIITAMTWPVYPDEDELGYYDETEKRNYQEGCAQAFELLKFLERTASEVIDVKEIASRATWDDRNLRSLKFLFEGYHFSLGKSEGDRQEALREVLSNAVSSGSIEASRFLITRGIRYNIDCLGLAADAYDNRREMIDEIINSGHLGHDEPTKCTDSWMYAMMQLAKKMNK